MTTLGQHQILTESGNASPVGSIMGSSSPRVIPLTRGMFATVTFGMSSPYKGVSWSKSKEGWRAQIGKNPRKNLGVFEYETEAALAYDRAALSRWGEFAVLNFPRARYAPRTGLRVLAVGFGRAGKDELASFAELHLGLRYGGSFSWAAKEFMADRLGIHVQTAWETRHQHRQLWKDWLDHLRKGDETLLAELALMTGDICAGLRDIAELQKVYQAGLFDQFVWVERPGVPKDPTVTFTVEDVLALGGIVINNNGTLEDYHTRIIHFFRDDLKEPVRLSAYAQGLLEKEAKKEEREVLDHE